MAKRRYKGKKVSDFVECSNIVKYNNDVLIVVVSHYDKDGEIYTDLMSIEGKRYIKGKRRWYIPEERFYEVALFINKHKFYCSQEATEYIRSKLILRKKALQEAQIK